jgi:surfeit locus 1 family protein
VTVRVGQYDFCLPLFPTLLVMALFALLISLGMWQLRRGDEKQGLLDAFTLRSQDVPLSIEADQTEAAELRYRQVVGQGVYDEVRQYLLDNRTYRGRVGYHVLTPLYLNGSVGVLVNRGWVPIGESRDKLPALPVPEERVSVRGTVLIPTEDAFLVGPAGYETEGWPRVIQRVELKTMTEQLGYRLLPYVVQLDPSEGNGFVREWQAYYGIGPERHRAYAFQWFSLAIALVVLFVVVNTRRQTVGPGAPP